MIGNYEIGKTIGEGTFGKVKLGIQIQTLDKVAIKVLEKDRICDVADVERVSREIHILKLIRHPNIIQLYEIIETPTRLYLIMEYASGGELFDYIVKHSKLSERESCVFFHEIIAGIEYIHKLQIVHRDLKPENLLLNDKNNLKIVDFGLSNTYKTDETLKTACGSPCYAAPEMIAGKQYKGLEVDLWSAGVILFAMICGYLPFEDSNTSQLYKKILAGEYQFPKFISKEAKDFLKRILTIEPLARSTIKEIKSHAWYKQCKEDPKPGILIGYDHIIVDSNVLSQLQKYGFDLDYTKKCLEANKHNNSTTVYYLILKKHVQSGGIALPEYRPFSRTKILNQTLSPSIKEEDFTAIFQTAKPQKSKRTESTGGTDSKKEYEKLVYSQINHERHISADVPRRFHTFSPSSLRSKNEKKMKAATPRPNVYLVKSKEKNSPISPIRFPNYRIKSDRKHFGVKNKKYS